MRRLAVPVALLAAVALLTARTAGREDKAADREEGFVSIFDGKSLKGWKVSAESGHSRTSKNKSGGKWYVDDKEKAIFGTQDVPGNGGIVITEEEYGDFEVRLDMRNDFGPDSGLFLRSNMKGQAYQAMIDYHKGGNLMGVYGEGIGGFHFRNYSFTDKVTEIKEEKEKSKFALPVAPEKWAAFWKHGEWNELSARIEGNPPKVTTWIKGVKFMEYQGDKKLLPDEGGIALQVHGGGDHTKEYVRYRNVRVKKLGKK